MKVIKIAIMATVMVIACSHSVHAQNAEEILKKHEIAIGGLEKWDRIKTIKKTGNTVSTSISGMIFVINWYG